MNRFRCCEGCSRHVLVSEQTCPFCKRALSAAEQRPQPKVAPGLSRAQRLAVAAAVAGSQALAGCAETTPPGGGIPGLPNTAGTSATAGKGSQPSAGKGNGQPTAGQLVQPIYGAPVYGAPVPVYGAPIAGQPSKPNPKDAGPADEDGGAASDAGVKDGGPIAHPVYGAPIPLYGAPLPQKK